MQTVVIIQGIVAVVAVVALILSVTSLRGQINDIRQSRQAAAADSCELLRRIVVAATPRTPAMQARAHRFLDATPLRDCQRYGRHLGHLR